MAMEVDEDDVWGAVATSPSALPPPVISTSLRRLAPLDPGPASRALGREMFLGPSAAVAGWAGAADAAGGPVDRRKKRMIKNRDSASRSRARNQAHATQIESEVVDLRQAMEQLRVKYEQLRASVEVAVPVKRTLQRTLSAPF